MIKKYFILFVSFAFLINCSSKPSITGGASSKEKTADQLHEELKQQEQAAPMEYLSADGTYKENIWGSKLKIKCNLHNKATLTSYKDIGVQITFFTKANAELGSKEYTIYEVVAANSDKEVEMKIDTYEDVAKIEWKVISATASTD